MQVRFLLGPAGSGKTHRCLTEIREALRADRAGGPLVFLAPKQATFQLERQLLAEPSLPGYTRLQILSFDRLARFVLEEVAAARADLLDEEGRAMVLRALLTQHQSQLKILRSTVRLSGFARQLSSMLRELQRYQHSPERLFALAARSAAQPNLSAKLHDLALLLRAYLDWLKSHELQDADGLLDLATVALHAVRNENSDVLESQSLVTSAPTDGGSCAWRKATTALPEPSSLGLRPPPLQLSGLWLDGFAEMTPQELDFLANLLPFCERATLAFCLESAPQETLNWLSTWSAVSQTFRQCYQRLASLPECSVHCETLQRQPDPGRFASNPVLRHLEEFWAAPQPFALPAEEARARLTPVLRLAVCPDPESEAVLAAREILRHVRGGGRFRDCAVLLRSLEGHHDALGRVFRRYDIPFFLDRRESVAHHPLAELTRYALRTLAFDWQHDDWFGVLKTGLVVEDETEIDLLENEALARGWSGNTWQQPLVLGGEPELEQRLERLRRRVVEPFQLLAAQLTSQPNGAQLASALRALWTNLEIGRQLAEWSLPQAAAAPSDSRTDRANAPNATVRQDTSGSSTMDNWRSALHRTVWEQMDSWLRSLELAFPRETKPVREWLPILEAGLAGLTVGVIPPALDQVLVGSIDRSRNPELQLALVLGLNESMFPATPTVTGLLTESDRKHLEAQGVRLGPNKRAQLGHERYYGYIACTRASRRLVLTCANCDAQGGKLNRSPFFDHLRRLFPQLEVETWRPPERLEEVEHVSELIPTAIALQQAAQGSSQYQAGSELWALPAVASALAKARQWAVGSSNSPLSPVLVEALYGRELRTSVSALEDFAACPFKFFVGHGLAAEERKRFELDARERGTFEHEILSRFHAELAAAGLRWREVTPAQARERIRRLGRERLLTYGAGLFQADPARRFVGDRLVEALETLIEVLVGWMNQYAFDPLAVEVAFGLTGMPLPAWRLDLGQGRLLALRGRIDRVDLWRDPAGGPALAVVVDYKLSGTKPDRVKLYHGLQLQLPAYLATLENLPEARAQLGVAQLRPAGIFYVNLRGEFPAARSRDEVLADPAAMFRKAYQHTGRFDRTQVDKLDGSGMGEQFKLSSRSLDPMDAGAFRALLDRAVGHIRRFGGEIFAGTIMPEPYRKRSETACQRCDFAAICRFDPWTQPFRSLPEPPAPARPPETPGSKRTAKHV